MNVCVIIPAAGRSSRYGTGDKLAQDLGGRAVLMRSVEVGSSRVDLQACKLEYSIVSPK